MKQLTEEDFNYNIALVKYENPAPRNIFNLMTVHSLLIDQNPKFIQLRQLVSQYNDHELNGTVSRPTLTRTFVQKLYNMLCELTKICHIENQLAYLDKIYKWAFSQRQQDQENLDWGNEGDFKQRPTTASTKTRPYSAHTRKTRPDSGIPHKQSMEVKKALQSEVISQKIMNQHPSINFKQLKHGEKDFFLGHRTLHPQQEKPRIKLKQYHRKVFYEQKYDEDDNFDEFVEEQEIEEVPKEIKLEEVPLEVEEPLEEEEQKNQAQNVQGGIGDQEVNIDDLVGEDEKGVVEEEEEAVEEVDKLKPNIKVYGKNNVKSVSTHVAKKKFENGMKKNLNHQQKNTRHVEQDVNMDVMMRQWAMAKKKVENQHRRRAESARIATKPIGPLNSKKIEKTNFPQGIQIIDLSGKTTSIKTGLKPQKQLQSSSIRARNQLIRDSLITGHLNNHLKKDNPNPIDAAEVKPIPDFSDCLISVAPKPKKKTFQEILRQADQKVQQDAQNQIQDVKEKLTMNKITLGANRIAKSLTYHEHEIYEGDFVGTVTGKAMLNNPFFKVAKKKKKKKKKK